LVRLPFENLGNHNSPACGNRSLKWVHEFCFRADAHCMEHGGPKLPVDLSSQ
jgi:hypothetical protein